MHTNINNYKLNNYKQCLLDKNYKIVKILKETKNNLVIKVKNTKDNKNYVAKILIFSLTINELEKANMWTEKRAMKYLVKLKVPYFVKYIEDWICYDNIHILIMEYLTGHILLEYDDVNMHLNWWTSLIQQLVLIVYILEKHKILHNDFWDANIVLQKIDKNINLDYKDDKINFPVSNIGFIVRIIDFQYTHQYKKDSKIIAPLVITNRKEYKSEQIRLGWSPKFHIGGDLNQILGILSDWEYIPKKLKSNIKKLVFKGKSKDFPYAIQKDNIKTSGKYLIKNINILFD